MLRENERHVGSILGALSIPDCCFCNYYLSNKNWNDANNADWCIFHFIDTSNPEVSGETWARLAFELVTFPHLNCDYVLMKMLYSYIIFVPGEMQMSSGLTQGVYSYFVALQDLADLKCMVALYDNPLPVKWDNRKNELLLEFISAEMGKDKDQISNTELIVSLFLRFCQKHFVVPEVSLSNCVKPSGMVRLSIESKELRTNASASWKWEARWVNLRGAVSIARLLLL